MKRYISTIAFVLVMAVKYIISGKQMMSIIQKIVKGAVLIGVGANSVKGKFIYYQKI